MGSWSPYSSRLVGLIRLSSLIDATMGVKFDILYVRQAKYAFARSFQSDGWWSNVSYGGLGGFFVMVDVSGPSGLEGLEGCTLVNRRLHH